jgi:thiamine biosynthesis lipoprotein
VAGQIEGFLRVMHRELTRFEPRSALSELNADPAYRCDVSPLLGVAVQAALWAARRSEGLVDPTQLPALERAGYEHSRAGVPGAPLPTALDRAPPRRAARPDPASGWKGIQVDPEAGWVRRMPGVRIDLGGSAKGLAADLASARLEGYASHVVDAGGDLRIGGAEPRPRLVQVSHPLREGPAHVFELTSGAVATSGIGTRVWRSGDRFAHHLIDPSTGRPAWTGVVQATALGETGVEAETLAKSALLSGPDVGAGLLARRGGVLVLDDGSVVVREARSLAVVGEAA